jgi:diadenosine tetraphosphate (Ap4A) HIT family hydrolase
MWEVIGSGIGEQSVRERESTVTIGATSVADCPFCRIVDQPGPSLFDYPLYECDEALVIPALGMLVEGYLLAVSRAHAFCFGELGGRLDAVFEWLDRTVMPTLRTHFGEYVIFEHGRGAKSEVASGSCVDHAHLHLIPAGGGFKSRLLHGLPWRRMSDLSALVSYADKGYSFLRISSETYVVEAAAMESQWVRRQLAATMSDATWDWLLDFGEDRLSATLEKLTSSSQLIGPCYSHRV